VIGAALVLAASLAAAQPVPLPLTSDPVILDGLRWYRDRPVEFVKHLLGGKPTDFQRGMLEDLAEHKRIAAHTGHRSGKTTTFVWGGLWFSCTRPHSKVVDTAPTFERQVKKIFWPELATWAKRLPAPHGFEITKTRLQWIGVEDWFITGESASQGENIAGFHADAGVMIIVDEASGVDDTIFEALEGALSAATGEFRILIGGNPTKRSGELARAKTTRRQFYSFHHQSSWDSPLVSKAWCEEKKRMWGETSAPYLVRVLGLPPNDEKDTLIPYHKIEEAVERWKEGQRPKNVAARIGVDVAYQGDDDSVAARRFSNRLEDLTSVHGQNPIEVGDMVRNLVRLEERKPASISVDGIGVGAGVVARLHEKQVPCSDVNVGSRSSKPEDFDNVRAELCWAMREWFMGNDAEIPDDDLLVGELSELKTRYLKTGKVGIEPKLEMKARLGRSPDRADALMLTFAGPGVDLEENPPTVIQNEMSSENWGVL
jgi:phage terminase large subunit